MLTINLRSGEVITYETDEWDDVEICKGFVVVKSIDWRDKITNIGIFAADTVEMVTTDE